MNGPMKKNKWNWILHAVLFLLALISIAASISNLYGPSSLNAIFGQVDDESIGETTTEMNNMAISNETNGENSDREVEITASQMLILHNANDEYGGIHNLSAIKEIKYVAAGFDYESEVEEDSAYNIRNYVQTQPYVEDKLNNETPINLLVADVSRLPEEVQEISITSYIYVLNTNEIYLLNEAENTAYALTFSDNVEAIMGKVDDYLAAYEDQIVAVEPVMLANGLAYLTKNEQEIDRLTYLQERQPTTYFLNHFFETPEDIHDYSMNNISRYYTEGRQLTINMETFEVALLQENTEVEEANLNQQIEVTSDTMADILADQASWLYAEANGDESDMVTYRKYVNSFPVFGNNYVSKAQFVMTGNAIQNIYMSALTIQTQVTDLSESYTIMSGESALNLLNNAGYSNQDISELVMGYRWVQNPETSRLVELVPSWHVQLGNKWFMIEDLIDMDQYPSLQTSYTESGDPVDLSVYFENLGQQVSEEEVKTQLDESLSESLSTTEAENPNVLNPPISGNEDEEG